MGEKVKKINNMNYIVKGILISIIFTFASLLLLATVLTYTGVSEKIINSSIVIINLLAILLGTTISIKGQKNNGIFKGGLIGLIYILVIYLISSFVSLNFKLSLGSIIMIITSIIAGMVGGIIGVNLNK